MCIYIHMCVYIHIYVCIYIYIYTQKNMIQHKKKILSIITWMKLEAYAKVATERQILYDLTCMCRI